MVKLFEYQGKRLLAKANIPIPKGQVAATSTQAKKIAGSIGKPCVIKAQVLATGRLAAGGVIFVDTPEEAENKTKKILNEEIKGMKVENVLIEEKLEIDQEFFLSVTVSDSYKIKGPIILFSTEGGVNIEEVAEKSPDKISRMNINYIHGLGLDEACKLISKLDVPTWLVNRLGDIACKLYGVFKEWDAHTVEVNPLIVTKDRTVIAADCRITLDDNSVYRHLEFKITLPRDMERPPTELEEIAWKIEEKDYRGTCYFIQLNPDIVEIERGGYIAFHGIGGGAAMLAADALIQKGIKLATYVDTSGNPTASKIYRAVKMLFSIPGIEGYCLAGAVQANQEQWYHAYALVKALNEESENRPGFPVLILIAGNKEVETHNIIKRGLKNLQLSWEIYGRDHIYDMNFLADRMKALMKEYRKNQVNYVRSAKDSVYTTRQKSLAHTSSREHLSFCTSTGNVKIDLGKCIAPDCGFACVKADRWYGRPCLKIEDGQPALIGDDTELGKTCNECLSCEVECDLVGGKAIKVTLPLYGVQEFRKKHGLR